MRNVRAYDVVTGMLEIMNNERKFLAIGQLVVHPTHTEDSEAEFSMALLNLGPGIAMVSSHQFAWSAAAVGGEKTDSLNMLTEYRRIIPGDSIEFITASIVAKALKDANLIGLSGLGIETTASFAMSVIQPNGHHAINFHSTLQSLNGFVKFPTSQVPEHSLRFTDLNNQ